VLKEVEMPFDVPSGQGPYFLFALLCPPVWNDIYDLRIIISYAAIPYL
jgi:hypothetical protein